MTEFFIWLDSLSFLAYVAFTAGVFFLLMLNVIIIAGLFRKRKKPSFIDTDLDDEVGYW